MSVVTTTIEPTARHALIRNTSVAFVIGATIMVFLHESSHSVAGALQGYHPFQLPFAVGYRPEQTRTAAVVTLLTGPLFSLVSGFVGVVVDRLVRPFRRRPFWRLVWLWVVFGSIQEGFGYFQIAGILPAGDTGQAFTLLGLPAWAFFVSTALGIAGMFFTAFLFAQPIGEMSSSISDMRALAGWPWIFGTLGFLALMVVYVLLTPGIDAGSIAAVLAGAVAVGVYAPMSVMFSRWHGPIATSAPSVSGHPIAGYVVVAALFVFNLTLTTGWLWP